MTPAAVTLLALVGGLLFFDFATMRKGGQRILLVECVVFLVGGAFIASPDVATRLAHAVGIGRGVDFVLYPLVIWLVRESLVGRRRRFEDGERVTEIVRALAIEHAVRIEVRTPPEEAYGESRAPSH
jgi:small membrane protein